MTNASANNTAYLRRLQLPALGLGVICLAASAVGAFITPERFFQSYLFSVIFWLDVSLGCLGILMIQYMIFGAWGAVIRRVLEAGTLLVPLMLVLFLPLLLGLPTLYEWIGPGAEQAELLAPKSAYLNLPFFFMRAAGYFVCWIVLAYLLRRWSLNQDRDDDQRWRARLSTLSRPGMILFVLTVTFAAYDWVMSLEPEWYSSIFGALFLAGQGLAGMTLTVMAAAYLARRGPLTHVLTPQRINDLGNLLLAFVMFWAYINLSQFLIIWSGNLPEEVTWYVHRTQNGWEWPIRIVLAFQFAGPFLVLLSRRAKRNLRALTILAAVIFVVHLIEVFWRVIPAFHRESFSLSWLDIVTPLGIGGVWVAGFLWLLGRAALVPLHDPRTPHLQEAVEYG